MKKFNVVIVEDEPYIAQFHSQYLKETSRFNPIGIAHSIREAKSMISIMKPDLIILDNYLPDGKGIDLMQELATKDNPPNVIFVTAASDMHTVRKAIRTGAFDYQLKPISYDRLQDSLDRFLKYMGTMESTDSMSQKYVDQMFNYQAKPEHTIDTLPKGIDQLTLDKVKEVFSDPCVSHTADSILIEVGISKTTARRYLEFCALSGFLKAEIHHGKIGRPERRYSKK
jgi:two-component system response regulator CitB